MSIFNNFPAVGAGGGDTSDATATSADILKGKTAYGADGKITGTIESVEGKQIIPKAAGQIAVAGNVYTTGARIIPKEDNFVPANIRKDVSIWGVTGTLDPGSTPAPDPNLIPANVKDGVTIDGVTGTFTGDGTIAADYVLDGFVGYAAGERIVGNIPSKDAQTYTPGTQDQYIQADQYISGAQKILGDANLVSGNIASGKTVFNVPGTFTSDANATADAMQLGVSAYVNGERVVGTAPLVQGATATPGTAEQTLAAAGSFLAGALKVAGDANLIADNIKQGVSIFGVTGTLAGGGGGYSYYAPSQITTFSFDLGFVPSAWIALGSYLTYSGSNGFAINGSINGTAVTGFSPAALCEWTLSGTTLTCAGVGSIQIAALNATAIVAIP